MQLATLSDREFNQFKDLIFSKAGISMTPAKKNLISGRLASRLKAYELFSYSDYFTLLHSGQHPDEMRMMVDLLTTNETYFFREAKHFDFLRDTVLAMSGGQTPLRIWSAASSSGQEAYTIAMILAEYAGRRPWEIMGSDISSRVLEKARTGLYAISEAEDIPLPYLKRYCLKGLGPQEGTFLIHRDLRSRVQFSQINLNTALPPLGEFDIVFLRNVMIYFNNDTKREVIARLLGTIKKGGYLLVGHSESLNGIADGVKLISPSVYMKL